MSQDRGPDRNREAEVRGGEAPDFGAMKPQDPPPDLVPDDPVPDDGTCADGS
jgi:hypothetical protein